MPHQDKGLPKGRPLGPTTFAWLGISPVGSTPSVRSTYLQASPISSHTQALDHLNPHSKGASADQSWCRAPTGAGQGYLISGLLGGRPPTMLLASTRDKPWPPAHVQPLRLKDNHTNFHQPRVFDNNFFTIGRLWLKEHESTESTECRSPTMCIERVRQYMWKAPM